MKTRSRLAQIALAGAIVAASGGAALGLTSIASASSAGDSGQQTVAAGRQKFDAESLAEALGLTGEEFRAELRSGKSIAQIADEQGIPVDAVKLVMIAEFSTRLDERVADGTLTREEADARLAKFTERLDTLVTRTKDDRPRRGERGERGERRERRMNRGLKGASEDLAAVLKMTVEELRDELRSGKSLAQIAEAQGVDIDDVKAVLIEKATERVDDMVNKTRPVRSTSDPAT